MRRIVPCSFVAMLICFVVFNKANGQYNLVPNPSFEIIDTCPIYVGGQIKFAPPWIRPLYPSSPDYMNACDTTNQVGVPYNIEGYETARTGSGYAFIAVYAHGLNPLAWNYRECLETPLTDTLKAGVNYCIRFYVSAADSMQYVTNNIGVYFSTILVQDSCVPVSNPCMLQYTPQFENPLTNDLNSRNGWTEIAGNYIASGGEKYIIIGNFRDSINTIATFTGWSNNLSFYAYAGYYIDDVLITPCDSLTSRRDLIADKLEIKIRSNIVDKVIYITSNEIIVSIAIYTTNGKNFYKSEKHREVNSEAIDVAGLAKGIYILEVLTKNKRTHHKFIKY